MIKLFSIVLILNLLNLNSSTIFAQSKSNDKRLTEQIDSIDFLIITISHGAERYERKEINVIHYQDSILKIHSILKSNYKLDAQIDTVFTLSEFQLTKLDKFGQNFNNKSLVGEEIWLGGTRTFYEINLNGKILTFDNKSGYSLILDLLTNE